MLKKISEVRTSCNARSSSSRQRKGNNFQYKRGTNKYYLFIQERFNDIYCLILKSVLYPIPKDNFKMEDLVKADKSLRSIYIYLKDLIKEKNKSITFSLSCDQKIKEKLKEFNKDER